MGHDLAENSWCRETIKFIEIQISNAKMWVEVDRFAKSTQLEFLGQQHFTTVSGAFFPAESQLVKFTIKLTAHVEELQAL